MIFTLFLISAAAMTLCIITAKKQQSLPVPMGVLFLAAALPTTLLGTALCHVPSSDPDAPYDTVTAFFEAVQDMDFAEADRILMGEDVFDTDGLSDEAQLMVQAMSDGCKTKLLGAPKIKGFSAVQTVRLTYADPDAIIKGMDEQAYGLLLSMMHEREAEELFTEDGSAYLPAVTQEVFQTVYDPLSETAKALAVTQTIDVTLAWTPFGWYIRPDNSLLAAVTGCPTTEASPSFQELDNTITAARTQFTASLPLLHKIYTLGENITVAPVPDPDGFHSTTDPQEVVAVIENAKQLLEGQSLSWSPDLELLPGSEIRYYYDHSILVIIWQELRDRCVVTFTEVKVAHPSQLFRTHCKDTYLTYYEAVTLETPTSMARRTNSVVAVTGDFYRRREIGTVVYQGKLYRNDPTTVDNCFFDANGDMHLVKQRELTQKQLAQFVEDKDIRFSASFGPILIKDGEKINNKWYSVGEILDRYDRCAIGQIDDLHYLILNANFTKKYKLAPVLSQAADYLYEKGCVQGYTLDGGQTGSLVFNGQLINQVNYGGERTSSDMICFASAIPDN